MSGTAVSRTYEEWTHYIIVLYGTPLTPAFVAERINSLANPDDFGTQRFIEV